MPTLPSPHPPSAPPVPEVHSGQQVLPLHLPPIQPILCPLGIYQSNETSDGFVEGLGHKDNNIHQRHADTGRVQGYSSTTLGSVGIPQS